jgi:glycosyltransferase involved in cell wall biosynthesis
MVAIAVVIPSFRVTDHILEVLAKIGAEVERIYVVDDACPDRSGELVQKRSKDKRVKVLFHEANQGVGGAVVTGYKAALADGMDVVVKVDGDGQMDPSLILTIAKPVLEGNADYAKGNRFDSLENQFTGQR